MTTEKPFIPKSSRSVAKVVVAIVAFEPDLDELKACINSTRPEEQKLSVDVAIFDNSTTHDLKQAIENAEIAVDIYYKSDRNLGFGSGINWIANKCQCDYLLIMNQDAIVKNGSLERAVQHLDSVSPQVACVEFRHTPYEHPKIYDPVTLQTPWVSAAALLIRKNSFHDVGGFDDRLFMYGEDVDLSIKLSLKQYMLIYLPSAVVQHEDLSPDPNRRSLQPTFDRANNLLLRLKYQGIASAMLGYARCAVEWIYLFARGESFSFSTFSKQFFSHTIDFLRESTSHKNQIDSGISFNGTRYCRHRLGAHYRTSPATHFPRVSIIIRTVGKIDFLVQAIRCCQNQTHNNIEIIVVDDSAAQNIENQLSCEHEPNILFINTGGKVGRSRAGNIGLRHSNGEFICFLDDDDLLYADHVETLVFSLQGSTSLVAYAFAEEVESDTPHGGIDFFSKHRVRVKYKSNEFSRVILWYKNFLPIQSVMFHRSLFDRLGGFDEGIDMYEDWCLWVKFSCATDFLPVPKVTSRYKVPATQASSRSRRKKFLTQWNIALQSQTSEMPISPIEFRSMVRDYIRHRTLISITYEGIAKIIERWRSLIS